MASIYDVQANELIEKTAIELAKLTQITPPEWAKFVKTGQAKQRPPARVDWWYVRSAAILRTVSLKGPIGVQKLRTKYGSKKDRGHRPEKFFKGSGSVLRKILQQLESAELVVQATKGVHKGRVVAPKGQSLLDKVATQVRGPKPAEAKKAPAKKAEKPAPKVEKKADEKPPKPEEKKAAPIKGEKPAPKAEKKAVEKPADKDASLQKKADEKPKEDAKKK